MKTLSVFQTITGEKGANQSIRGQVLPERPLKRRCHDVGGALDRFGREVGVPDGGLHLSVAAELADYWKALTKSQCSGREGVPQVMKSDVLQAGTGADAAPGALQVSNMGTRQSVGDHPRVAISTG